MCTLETETSDESGPALRASAMDHGPMVKAKLDGLLLTKFTNRIEAYYDFYELLILVSRDFWNQHGTKVF
jgi:hypothetical protein